MTEENSAPAKDSASPAKKAPAKRKPTAKAASKAAAAKKTSTRKSAAPKKKAAQSSPEQSSPEQSSPETTEQSSARTNPPASEEPRMFDHADNRENNQGYDASNLVEDLKGRDWPKIIQRALLMVFFGFLAWVTISVAFFLATAQVVISIFAGEPNAALTRLIKQGANYIHDVLDYLSFASDECPFPFGRKLPEAD